jgi:hypothetical protein
VLRRLVFNGWSSCFFDDRALRRLRAQRQKETDQLEAEKKASARAAVVANAAPDDDGPDDGAALPGAAEPTLEDMLRQIGGAAAARGTNAAEEGDGDDDLGSGSSRVVMSDAAYSDLVQYLQLRRLTLGPCTDPREAAWRRSAVSSPHPFLPFPSSQYDCLSTHTKSSVWPEPVLANGAG